MAATEQQQQQQQANRGILPSETLNALDYLVDRLNSASGSLPASLTSKNNDGAASSASPSTESSNEANNNKPLPPIRALLVGTNEGVGLSRSLGTAHTKSINSNNAQNDPNSHSGTMSEEVLSSIETVWATLVSAAPPHVMAASAAGAAAAAAAARVNTSEEKKEDTIPPHIQPAHPLLSPLQMGDHIKTVTATYDNCTLVHVHMAPLVVTFVTLPDANIGAIRTVALPLLKVLLEPVRRALVRSRGAGAVGAGGAVSGSASEGSSTQGMVGQPGQAIGSGMQGQLSMEQQAVLAQQQQQQQQVMAYMQQQQAAQHAQMLGGQQQAQQLNAQMQQQQVYGGQQMDPALQQQLYQQQLYQQQLMMAQQQQQQQGQFRQ